MIFLLGSCRRKIKENLSAVGLHGQAVVRPAERTLVVDKYTNACARVNTHDLRGRARTHTHTSNRDKPSVRVIRDEAAGYSRAW